LKAGQIAHLDRNSSNSAADNLAFLCLEHHDEYDSRTSQRKGLTPGEVKQMRAELHGAIGKAFSVEVHFGAVTLPENDPYAGQFIRLGSDPDSAEIILTPVPDYLPEGPAYAVAGFAVAGAARPYGPNLGFMRFIGTLVDGIIEERQPSLSEGVHLTRLIFRNGGLSVEEENWFGAYGMGVHFNGEYRRA
jgi:hypothetical protein